MVARPTRSVPRSANRLPIYPSLPERSERTQGPRAAFFRGRRPEPRGSAAGARFGALAPRGLVLAEIALEARHESPSRRRDVLAAVRHGQVGEFPQVARQLGNRLEHRVFRRGFSLGFGLRLDLQVLNLLLQIRNALFVGTTFVRAF